MRLFILLGSAILIGYVASGTVASAQNESQVGSWTAPICFPVEAISLTLLPTGKVMMWGRTDFGDVPTVWDMTAGTFTAIPALGTDVFCSGSTFLSDGTLFVAGGDVIDFVGLPDTVRFDPFSQTWSRLPNMSYARWYPTLVPMTDGRVIAFSGSQYLGNNGSFVDAVIPEIYDFESGMWSKLSTASFDAYLYRCMYQLPSGQIAMAGKGTPFGTLDPNSWTWNINNTWSGQNYVGFAGGGGAMFLPGKILKVGGVSHVDQTTAVPYASILDYNLQNPMWKDIPSMAFPRLDMTTTTLPDGTVLVAGGSTVFAHAKTCIKTPELLNPKTNLWTQMAPHQIGRSYHGTAILLPDGRVLLAGSGQGERTDLSNPDQLNGEIFSPPYLFKGPRPVILSAPDLLVDGSQFTVTTDQPNNISQINLIRLGSMTHTFDQSTMFVPCSFSNNQDGSIAVTAPTRNLATAGYFMLFLVNSNGVPSVSKIVLASEKLAANSVSQLAVTIGSSSNTSPALVGSIDGKYLTIKPVAGQNGMSSAQAVFTVPVNHQLVSSLQVDVDSLWRVSGASQLVELYDFNQGIYVPIGSAQVNSTQSDQDIVKTMGVSQYLDPVLRTVQVRVTWVGRGSGAAGAPPVLIDAMSVTATR